MVGGERSFLIDGKLLGKVTDLADSKREDVAYVIGAGNGQLAGTLCEQCRIIVVEPDDGIASYVESLYLYKTMVIRADPLLVLGDLPFDRLLSLQPELVSVELMEAMLRISFQKAALVMPDEVFAATRTRNRLGTLFRACFNFKIEQSVHKTSFSPPLPMKCSLISIVPKKGNNVDQSLQLLAREVGTMRGLLTRSCREFFGYTLADAQSAVRMIDISILKNRFWNLSEEEFKVVYDWLKLG